MAPDLAFNTAVSFTTNTNWQAYSGESTMSYFTQMAGLAYHNFVSAAVGIAVAIAFIRGIAQKEKDTIGNFWVDMVRASLWVLLPISIVGALFLRLAGRGAEPQAVRQGACRPQTVTTTARRQGRRRRHRADDRAGPVASQEIIKQFGTNGGGFFNANSAHPFENPTPLTNFLAMFGIFAISSGLTYTLGSMTGSRAHGWAVWAAMAFLFLAGVTDGLLGRGARQPDADRGRRRSDGHARRRPAATWKARKSASASPTRRSSPRSRPTRAAAPINGWHDSFTPLGGLVPLANIQLSEVVFGGVGAGMYGVLVYIILAVFIAGLMVGRTPEYLGKKIQAFEVQMAMLTVLIFSLLILTLHRDLVGVAGLRHVEHLQPRPARAVRDALRLLVGGGQQRLGVRRHQRQHELVQHDARPDDAVRAVLHDHPAARHRRQPGPQEARFRRRSARSR